MASTTNYLLEILKHEKSTQGISITHDDPEFLECTKNTLLELFYTGDLIAAEQVLIDTAKYNQSLFNTLLPAIAFGFSGKKLEQIIYLLLKNGLDCNTIIPMYNKTLIQFVAGNGFLALTQYLLNVGADPNLLPPLSQQMAAYVTFDINDKNKLFDFYYQSELTTLQLAIGRYLACPSQEHEELCELLFNRSKLPFNLELFQERISQLYIELYDMIANFILSANEKGKILIFLLGEDHHDFSSLLIEQLFIHAMYHQNLSLILTEHDEAIDREIKKKNFDSINIPGCSGWIVGMTVQALCSKLNIKTQPVDLAHRTYSQQLRDQVMFDTVHQKVNTHAAMIIGYSHFSGLIKQGFLCSDKFDVVAFNVSKKSVNNYDADATTAKTSNEIIQLHHKIPFDISIIPPSLIMKFVEEAALGMHLVEEDKGMKIGL